MDGCVIASLTQLAPTADQIKTGLSILGSVVIGASVITSITPTPAAGTRLARAYRYIEIAALLFGRAKDRGVLPATPAADKALADAIAIGRRSLAPPPPPPQKEVPFRKG